MKYSLSDQERAARRQATAAMPKCSCGNVAGLNRRQCRGCEEKQALRDSFVSGTEAAEIRLQRIEQAIVKLAYEMGSENLWLEIRALLNAS